MPAMRSYQMHLSRVRIHQQRNFKIPMGSLLMVLLTNFPAENILKEEAERKLDPLS